MIYSVAFSTDGETLIVSSSDNQIRFFQAADGAETSSFTPQIDTPLSIMVSADTSGIIIGSDTDARTYELNTSVLMPNVPAVVGSSGRRAVFDPTASMFAAVVNTQGKIVFIDLIRNRGANLKELAVSGRSPYEIAFSPDGRLFASGGRDGLITLWGIPTGE